MWRLGLVLAAAVVVVDQVSKAYFYNILVAQGRPMVEILPFFNLVTVWNKGISFGLFGSGSMGSALVFTGLALAIVAVLVVWLRRTDQVLPAAALGLVIGGALGNVIDRVRFGAVFDFLDFHAYGWHWPAFNAADAAITLGVAGLFIDALFGGKRSVK
ncbi:MAG: signal peptidase II [Rhodospirillales bacterium]|nr:signal peptidase II [Rhodospirillales bacterium]